MLKTIEITEILVETILYRLEFPLAISAIKGDIMQMNASPVLYQDRLLISDQI